MHRLQIWGTQLKINAFGDKFQRAYMASRAKNHAMFVGVERQMKSLENSSKASPQTQIPIFNYKGNPLHQFLPQSQRKLLIRRLDVQDVWFLELLAHSINYFEILAIFANTYLVYHDVCYQAIFSMDAQNKDESLKAYLKRFLAEFAEVEKRDD
ncbi:hypothetical protein DVH24_025752 [Malus domestica]|uniref:Uncharacterized protein n=1 Tax=Malus domestica TaxID=3750 RepID=A0A498KGW4_MALDO|nr:hypothetical protein DVH24_025752 [Malus domestica]